MPLLPAAREPTHLGALAPQIDQFNYDPQFLSLLVGVIDFHSRAPSARKLVGSFPVKVIKVIRHTLVLLGRHHIENLPI